MRLANASYAVARTLPDEERCGLAAQIRGAAVSIAANIAEGKGRRTKADFARFLAIARGSARELDTLVDIAVDCGMTKAQSTREAKQLVLEVLSMLTVMLRHLAPL